MTEQLFQQAAEKLEEIKNYAISDAHSLEQFRIAFLGSKNTIRPLFGEIRNIDNARKKEYGQYVNLLKQTAEERYEQIKSGQSTTTASSTEVPDLTRNVAPEGIGTRHPLSLVQQEICDIFKRIGFTISEGPQIEDDWHNFSALNFPPNHPARDMQDTFFISENEIALRTHTSSVQIRTMEHGKPPFRTISPGRVFRNETISARAHCQFHQVEGLYVDKNVSLADLRQTLLYFANEMFGQGTKIRLRPSYFPFTEISAEMDISCFVCDQKGCSICKKTGWVEILGCGMVDPNVLKNCGIDPEEYTGFAFGMGVERITMLKYKVNDIRLFFENDIRFLDQFASVV